MDKFCYRNGKGEDHDSVDKETQCGKEDDV